MFFCPDKETNEKNNFCLIASLNISNFFYVFGKIFLKFDASKYFLPTLKLDNYFIHFLQLKVTARILHIRQQCWQQINYLKSSQGSLSEEETSSYEADLIENIALLRSAH